jgi:hypothetical protein
VGENGEIIDHAYIRLAELGARLPVEERAAILRQGGLRLRSPRLVAAMAARMARGASRRAGRRAR